MTSSSSSANQDALTGLLTIRGWNDTLVNGVIMTDGMLIALHLAGMSGLTQKSGQAAGDEFFVEVVHRLQQLLSPGQLLMRGEGNGLLLWLPALDEITLKEMMSCIRKATCAAPVVVEGDVVQANLITASLPVSANMRVSDATHALERELVRQPEFCIPPTSIEPAVLAQEELDRRLAHSGLFGRDALVEQILASLQLPGLHPQTVVLVGPAQAGKYRVMSTVVKLLGSQHLPIAEITCHATDQFISCTLLVTLIQQFIASYPRDLLEQRLGYIVQANTWLGSLFPVLRRGDSPPSPPDDVAVLRRILEAVLLEMVRLIPHVAIIYNFQLADEDSLLSLCALQDVPGQGLRIITDVEPVYGAIPAQISQLLPANTTVITLKPLLRDQLSVYLQQTLPEIYSDELLSLLYDATGGVPLAVELTLRSWTEDHAIDDQAGTWSFHADRIGSSQEAGLSDIDRRRLGKAALAGPTTIDFLCALWNTSVQETKETVEQGRILGYLRSSNIEKPEEVQFDDQYHVNSLAHQLTRQERMSIHQEIARLLESLHADNLTPYARDLVYHFTQAGAKGRAKPYLSLLHLPIPATTPDRIARTPLASDTDDWNIPSPTPVQAGDIELIIAAALVLRFAAIQFRLYPSTSEIARSAVLEAHKALEMLFKRRSSLVITFDNNTVAFDGQIMQRREMQMTNKDFIAWMSEGQLRAIGFAKGVREEELASFLDTIGTVGVKEPQASLLQKIVLLNLEHIKVLPHVLLQMFSTAGEATTTIEHDAASGQLAADMSHAAPVTSAEDTRFDVAHLKQLSKENWQELPLQIAGFSTMTRQTLMNSLSQWLATESQLVTADIMLSIDALLCNSIQDETDDQVFQETITILEYRLTNALSSHDWSVMQQLLFSVHTRMSTTSADHSPALTVLLGRIGLGLAKVIQELDKEDFSLHLPSLRQIVTLLGEHTLRPMLTTLKKSVVMRERIQLMQLLREFGSIQQPFVLEELRAANSWFVYRNLLQLLTDVGTEAALPYIQEKISHADARVRIEAVTAATKIARNQAILYLTAGLQDANPEVKARSAALVAYCPQPPMLHLLLRLLQSRLGREEPEHIQIAACVSLGYFQQEEARDALLQIVNLKTFTLLSKKSDAIRCAAISALGFFLPHPAVEAALTQALADKNPQIRAAAQYAKLTKVVKPDYS